MTDEDEVSKFVPEAGAIGLFKDIIIIIWKPSIKINLILVICDFFVCLSFSLTQGSNALKNIIF